MRRFRFVGDTEKYYWLDNGGEYDVTFNDEGRQYSVGRLAKTYPEDWIEIDQPKPLHKDTDLGYFAGLAMAAIIKSGDLRFGSNAQEITFTAFNLADELIKQLNE